MLNEIFKLVKEVGSVIMQYYNRIKLINISYKSDGSPVTKVDKIADNIIKNRLKTIYPEIPLLSEENLSDWNRNKNWNKYWLIDPLDGTKEFLNKRCEFTVNVALIKKGIPVFSVIYVPFFKILYYTDNNKSWKEEKGHTKQIHVYDNIPPRIALSYSHPDNNIDNYLEKLGSYEIIKIGSSFKFCLIAEGKIQFYPRFGRTKIWDTAAGDALVTAAGGIVNTWNQIPLNYYPKLDFFNPGFFAATNTKLYDIIFNKYKINNELL
ncbi:3'(2'),5'-bisphosphate nucleotidase CysQ [Buchnera aphidicola (Pemphigus obesinymphae)]|uniref:3'(2'),5'-bisphosphate nucleotidase CysQ n=1 Tax=Buchnera aphidicola TaxID=9 RepID=UPI002237DBE4|nr:3'(2'),5'-bisphosphate nucleotidase CysQ [Buchnera aphidicola]MCW5196454.1 3'(2'),5'-bisphosphate nucleotidase CysQ [Buchnera aphidicola (Pemphigus obesinymphae)]